MERSFDLTIVTYNSEKWIEPFLSSFHETDYDLKNINLFFVDNGSTDSTIKKLKDYDKKSVFGEFKIIDHGQNVGYGQGNNIGAKHGKSDYVFIINVDTEVTKDMFKELSSAIENSDESIGAWELRQFPFEHPKFYDPVTLETSWCSGAAVVVRRDIFDSLCGFDDKIFMYAEDVDLSWRIRAKGYKLMYVPKSVIIHHSYSEKNQVKPLQFKNSILNNLFLRYKFGSYRDIINGYYMISRLLMASPVIEGQKKVVADIMLKGILGGSSYRRSFNRNMTSFKPNFLGFDYEFIRDGAFYENRLDLDEKPLVSIIVRTHKRPKVLRETLISLRNQTYKNYEIIIIEDGQPTSQNMILEEFHDLPITYEYTGVNKGRSFAGNRAMEIARGDFFNFLDDDDLFFSDHLEVLVNGIIENKGYKAVYSSSFETPITVYSKDPYEYEIGAYSIIHNKPFNRHQMISTNMFPIQAVLFHRSFFEKYGGFNTELDFLEDWDLWLRYTFEDDFLYINKTTSIYRVPANKELQNKRHNELMTNYESIKNKYLCGYLSSNEIKISFDNLNTENSVKSYIDEISAINNNMIHIRGWAFVEGIDNSESEILIEFLSDDGNYVLKTGIIERKDVQNHFSQEVNIDKSGFEIYISVDELENRGIERFNVVIKSGDSLYRLNEPIILSY